MKLLMNQTIRNDEDKEPTLGIYLELGEDGTIQLCADTEKEWGHLLAEVTTDGRFVPNINGVKNSGLEPDDTYFEL